MENKKEKTILVTGATGKQGGAVADHLLRDGWQVRILCRDPGKEKAKGLASRGAEIVRGDFNDAESLRRACKGAYGVFSVQNFWETGAELETKQGIALADAAREAGVKHFVYSSVGGAERNTGLSHFDSKWRIELAIRERQLPATILRPVFFMDNYCMPQMGPSVSDGLFRMPLPADCKLQMIAVDDIGAFAAIAFSDPDGHIGKELEIAGDEPTMAEAADFFGHALSSPIRFEEIPLEAAKAQHEESGKMFQWFREQGYKADIAALRRVHPGLLPFHKWVETVWMKTIQVDLASQR